MSIYSSVKIYDPDMILHLEFNRNEYLQKCINNKTVLHVGCTDYPVTQQRINERNLLHSKLNEKAKDIVGIDLSEDGVRLLREYGFKNIFLMDAEDINLSIKFDCILAGDVIEHLNNPGLFLDKARQLLNNGAELIVGVPSALTINNIKAWFLGREQVHSDHTFYFSPKTLSALCKRFDLLPVKLVFTVQPPGSYESSRFVLLRKVILNIFKSSAPSFIMHYKKSEDVDKSKFVEWK